MKWPERYHAEIYKEFKFHVLALTIAKCFVDQKLNLLFSAVVQSNIEC